MTDRSRRPVIQIGAAYFFYRAEFWFPIWVILLQSRGISLGAIVAADVFFRAVMILLELPLGVVGDRIGRKRTYLLSVLFASVAFTLLIFTASVPMLFFCWSLWAVSICFSSGTDNAYQYELIVEAGLKHQTTRYLGFMRAIACAALLISHSLAGFLYEIRPELPIVANVIFFLIAGGLILAMPSHPIDRDETPFVKSMWVSVKLWWNDGTIRHAVILLSTAFAYFWTTTILFQPLLIELGLEAGEVGLMYLLFSAAGIVTGLATGRLVNRLGGPVSVFVGAVLQVGSVSAVGFLNLTGCLVGILLLSVGFFLAEPVLRALINHQIPNHLRAAILSLTSVIASLIMIASRPLVGLVAESHDTQIAFQIWGIAGVAFLLLTLWSLRQLRAVSRKEWSEISPSENLTELQLNDARLD